MSEGEGYYTVILPPGTTQRATRGGFLMCLLDQENHLTLPIPVILSPLTVVQSYHFLFASKPKPHITNNKYPPPQPSHLDVPVGIFCFDNSDFSRKTGGETRQETGDFYQLVGNILSSPAVMREMRQNKAQSHHWNLLFSDQDFKEINLGV